MTTISVNHAIFSGQYYTETQHTDPTSVAASLVAESKIERFYIELNASPDQSNGQILSIGSITFNDAGTVTNNATVEAEFSGWPQDVSSGHLEPMGGPGYGLGDTTLTSSDGSSFDIYGYVQLYGLIFDGNQEAREEILVIFPELAAIDYDASITSVRPILSGRQSRKLTVRHIQNRKALWM